MLLRLFLKLQIGPGTAKFVMAIPLLVFSLPLKPNLLILFLFYCSILQIHFICHFCNFIVFILIERCFLFFFPITVWVYVRIFYLVNFLKAPWLYFFCFFFICTFYILGFLLAFFLRIPLLLLSGKKYLSFLAVEMLDELAYFKRLLFQQTTFFFYILFLLFP